MWAVPVLLLISVVRLHRVYDSTLGFPGEGPTFDDIDHWDFFTAADAQSASAEYPAPHDMRAQVGPGRCSEVGQSRQSSSSDSINDHRSGLMTGATEMSDQGMGPPPPRPFHDLDDPDAWEFNGQARDEPFDHDVMEMDACDEGDRLVGPSAPPTPAQGHPRAFPGSTEEETNTIAGLHPAVAAVAAEFRQEWAAAEREVRAGLRQAPPRRPQVSPTEAPSVISSDFLAAAGSCGRGASRLPSAT